jgi:hypothetical protein
MMILRVSAETPAFISRNAQPRRKSSLRRAKEQTRSVVENVVNGIITIDEQGVALAKRREEVRRAEIPELLLLEADRDKVEFFATLTSAARRSLPERDSLIEILSGNVQAVRRLARLFSPFGA